MTTSKMPLSEVSIEEGQLPNGQVTLPHEDAQTSASLDASPTAIQPLHQGSSADSLETQRQLLQQKIAEQYVSTYPFGHKKKWA
jgi:hypothetical protein